MMFVGSIIFLVIFALASSRVIDRCLEWYISSEGINCTYCPQGTYKYQDCTQNGESAICKGCGYDYYQTFCNQALSCAPCSQVCPWRFSHIYEACTMYSDVKCTCEQGKYLFKETSKDGVCLNYNQCDKGYGLVQAGTPLSDTVCESCLEGKTFSDDASLQHCKPCKLCAEFRKNCSTIQDAECGDKTTADNTDNELDTKATHEIERVVYPVSIIVLVIVLAVLSLALLSKIKPCGNSRSPGYSRSPENSRSTNEHTELIEANKNRPSTHVESPELTLDDILDSPTSSEEETGQHRVVTSEKEKRNNHGNPNNRFKESSKAEQESITVSTSVTPLASTSSS